MRGVLLSGAQELLGLSRLVSVRDTVAVLADLFALELVVDAIVSFVACTSLGLFCLGGLIGIRNAVAVVADLFALELVLDGVGVSVTRRRRSLWLC